MKQVRSTVIFRGRVQGVGFRYTACRIADGFDVTGWVRNEPDGAVTCVAEGEEGEVERFLVMLNQAMGGLIIDRSVSTCAAAGDIVGFTIRR
jgi:acylphosphatase